MANNLTIYIGADHRGFKAKQRLIDYLDSVNAKELLDFVSG